MFGKLTEVYWFLKNQVVHIMFTIHIIIPNRSTCRDLGVRVDDNIQFRKHYEIITRNAHYKCKQFRRTFSCHDIEFLVSLYKIYILPGLEYGSSVWNPYYIRDVDLIENVQRKFTKFIPGMFHKSYQERLIHANLITLEERRIYLDLILLFKIIHRLVELDTDKYFTFSSANTRGHNFKLVLNHSQINCHKYHFFNRVVKIWNDLPRDIVNIESVNNFKLSIFSVDVKRHCIGRANTA